MNLQQQVVLLHSRRLTAQSFPSLAHYWDNRFDGQCFQDTGLTTPSVSGEVVGGILDRQGNAPLTSATNKPVNRQPSGGEWDGTNDTMTATITAIPASGFTLYYKVFPDDFDSVQVHLDWGDMTIASLATSGLVRASQSSVGTIATSVAALTVSVVNTVGFRYNPTTGAFRFCINAETPNTGTQIRAITGTSLNVGTESVSSFPFDGKLLPIAIHTALHTDAEMDAAMAYWRGV